MARGGKALAIATDVTQRGQVQKLMDAAAQSYGRIDVMINNAGLMPQAPLEQLKIDEWDRMIDVTSRACCPHRRSPAVYEAAESGDTSSTSPPWLAIGLGPGFAVCAATKHAVRAIRRVAAGSESLQHPHDGDLAAGVAMELPQSATDTASAERVRKLYEEIAIPAESFARAVAFAISQPDDVDVNEILFRPTRQEV